jgi:hypothetical protein
VVFTQQVDVNLLDSRFAAGCHSLGTKAPLALISSREVATSRSSVFVPVPRVPISHHCYPKRLPQWKKTCHSLQMEFLVSRTKLEES